MLQKIWKIMKFILFLGALGLTLCAVTVITLPKVPDFYKEKEWDVVFFGTSQSYCTFAPIIFDEYGLKTYNRGRQQQTMNYTYYYIKDALEVSDIDVVVLEVFGMFYDEDDERFTNEHIRESSLGDFRYSKIKMEAIQDCVAEELQQDYLFPLDKYHTNWEKWNVSSGTAFIESVINPYYTEDSDRGYMRWDATEWFWYPDVNEFKNYYEEVYKENFRYLEMIYELCKEQDVELVLVRGPLPCYDTILGKTNTIEAWAKLKGVDMINYMYLGEEIDLNEYTDSLDGGTHLNQSGAGKVSHHLANYLVENYFSEN